MLAKLHERGGSHRIISRTPELAKVEITLKGQVYEFSLSWDEAQKEPFPYAGKESDVVAMLLAGKTPKLKPKYATPRSRAQMMWARVVSDGVRSVDPGVCAGTYTPEEVSDFELEGVAAVAMEPVIDVQYESVQAEPTKQPPQVDDGKATGQQIATLTELFGLLNVHPDSQLAAMKKRGATDMSDLSADAAEDLITSLQGKLDAATEGKSRAVENVMTGPSDGPCDESQINEIKNLIKQLAQTDGEAQPNRIKAHLQASGMKLADLSRSEADLLLQGLAVKNMEAFFDASLRGSAKND
jgi:lambda repressor-like predicted transcriptional regulator